GEEPRASHAREARGGPPRGSGREGAQAGTVIQGSTSLGMNLLPPARSIYSRDLPLLANLAGGRRAIFHSQMIGTSLFGNSRGGGETSHVCENACRRANDCVRLA